MVTGERVKALRKAARTGDAEAARELGRLMCLVPQDPEDREQAGEFDLTWPAERWLRLAISVHADDALAKKFLAGMLIRQIMHWQNVCEIAPDVDEVAVAAENDRRRTEAERLCSEVLQVDPDDRTARAGLAALAAVDVIVDTYPEDEDSAFYCVEHEVWSGSVRTLERLFVTDPDELRWACDTWLGLFYRDWPLGDLTLAVYCHGKETGRIRLDEHFDEAMDWTAITIPPLAGRVIPAEHTSYGYTVEVG